MNAGKFNEQIYRRIEECSDFLMLLTSGCLDRCSNADDWVRVEYEHALKCRKRIIPIAARGFQFPDTMPASMRDLPDFERVEATAGDMEYVVRKLKRLMSAKPLAGQGSLFSVLSTPALSQTTLRFLQKIKIDKHNTDYYRVMIQEWAFRVFDNLLHFDRNIDLADYWREIQSKGLADDSSIPEIEFLLRLREPSIPDGSRLTYYPSRYELDSVWQTLCALRDMQIISSAPCSMEDLWEEPVILDPNAFQDLLVAARTYCAFDENMYPASEKDDYYKNILTRINGAFLYQGQSYQLVDVIEYHRLENEPPQKYAIAICRGDALLPEHAVFQVNLDDSLVLIEQKTQLFRELFLQYATVYRMLSPLPFCYPNNYYDTIPSLLSQPSAVRQTYDFLPKLRTRAVAGY